MVRRTAPSIRLPLALVAALVAIGVGLGGSTPTARSMPSDDGWTPLFNGRDLDGWYTWLPSSGRNNDPRGVFRVHDGMLHILDIPVGEQDQEFGYVATVDEYAAYRLRFQYRWGEKRFPPRAAEKRDSGLLYHVVGADLIWPRSLECQVQEGDTGDLFLLGGTGLTTTVESLGVDEKKYRDRGVPHVQVDGRIVKSGTHESPTDWNTVEVVVADDVVVHVVNGVVNNRGTSPSQPDPADPARMIPLTRGRILFQAEGAEVYYRGIEMQPLDEAGAGRRAG